MEALINFNSETPFHFSPAPEKTLQQTLSLFLDEDQVKSDLATRLVYARSTLSEGTVPKLIVSPYSTQQVQKILRVANKFKCRVHPISTGKNWGYSDACALGTGVLLLDLSRMNKIHEVNPELGYAVIEPGVTQGQLQEYLNQCDVPFWMDATGAGPDTSIIGNTMERGFGHSPLGDRYANSCNYEIVLPTGELLNTGFGQYQNSKVSDVYKWGLGPAFDGLFTQSNLGVVTRMTVWLMPKPESFKVCSFVLEREDLITDFIDAIRPLRMDGTLKSVIHIGNDLRLVSMSQSFPFEDADSGKALSRSQRNQLIENHSVGWWSGTAGFYGSADQVKADIRKFKQHIKGIKGVKIFIIDEYKVKLAQKLSGLCKRKGIAPGFSNLIDKVQIAYDLLKGVSPLNCVQGGLWRTRNAISVVELQSSNPLDYGAGFYWISPVIPMQGKALADLNALVEPVFHKYGFDMQQTISLTTERALSVVLTISFDKSNDVEALKARVCHDEIVRLVMKKGFILYRAGNHTMDLIHEKANAENQFLKAIKNSLDPNNILSPGRYILE